MVIDTCPTGKTNEIGFQAHLNLHRVALPKKRLEVLGNVLGVVRVTGGEDPSRWRNDVVDAVAKISIPLFLEVLLD